MHIFTYLHINAFIMMISIFFFFCFALFCIASVVQLYKRTSLMHSFQSKAPFDILNFHIVFFGLNTK